MKAQIEMVDQLHFSDTWLKGSMNYVSQACDNHGLITSTKKDWADVPVDSCRYTLNLQFQLAWHHAMSFTFLI